MILIVVFILTVASGLVAVTGGNGLILMPALLMLDFDIKQILVLVRVSAVVFVAFNLLAMIRTKNVVSFRRQDLFITLISCATVLLSITFLNKLDSTVLMFIISIMLIILFLLVILKPKTNSFSWIFILFLPIFAGICGSAVGGAGLIISVLYTLLGASPVQAVQKRVIPSLIIQIIAFATFVSQGVRVDIRLMLVVIIATAISGYLNMKIFMNLSPRNGKILFYLSFLFSIGNLLEDVVENVLTNMGADWSYLSKFLTFIR